MDRQPEGYCRVGGCCSTWPGDASSNPPHQFNVRSRNLDTMMTMSRALRVLSQIPVLAPGHGMVIMTVVNF